MAVVLMACVGFVVGILRLLMVLPVFRRRKHTKPESIHALVVLGSGGHTGEMMPLVHELSKWKRLSQMTVVAATSDTLSLSHPLIPETAAKKTIPRARNVGQSFFTSIFTTFAAFISALRFIFLFPDLLLVNGPGVCYPVVLSIFLGNFIGITNCSIVFVESFCRVTTISLTGKLIYPFCDLFFVHWPQLLKLRRRARLVDAFGLFKQKPE